jgi:hypothetical protein
MRQQLVPDTEQIICYSPANCVSSQGLVCGDFTFGGFGDTFEIWELSGFDSVHNLRVKVIIQSIATFSCAVTPF